MATVRSLDGALPRQLSHGPSLAPAMIVIACAIGASLLTTAYSWRQGALFVVGVAAGLVLYHAAFGFTSAWRQVIVGGSGAALRAEMLMLAVTCLVFFPLLSRGELLGQPLRGAIAPLSVGVVLGAFLFGIGMQLGGGCASGTLYSAGGGSVRMLITLAAFIAGSVLGAHDSVFWDGVPALAPISLVDDYGLLVALAVTSALLAIVTAGSIALDRLRASRLAANRASERAGSWLRGPWPLAVGAVGLAIVNVATLVLAGRPWGVTSAFALWGSKLLLASGVDVAAWPYWASSRAEDLQASIFRDVTSVMDIGIVLGALLAAVLADRFQPAWRVPIRSAVAAVVGGLLLGYGSRIAYGCNIGAFFSGVASSSMHGWVWFVAAFAGNIVGAKARPWFGLDLRVA